MAKDAPTQPDEAPPSETLRVVADLVEALRFMCFNGRDRRNKRLKITQLSDALFRPIILEALAEFKRRQEAGEGVAVDLDQLVEDLHKARKGRK